MSRDAATQGHGNQCSDATCKASAWSFFEGRPLCFQHYRGRLTECFEVAYGKWVETEPPRELKYLLGRMYAEFGRVAGPSYLSAARIRDRAFAFRKTPAGAEFRVTRHLHSWTANKPMKRVVERWEVNLAHRAFNLLETLPWREGDSL